MGPYGPTAILDAILNKKKCPNLIFTPPTENDPWDPYNDGSSEKMFIWRQGVPPKKPTWHPDYEIYWTFIKKVQHLEKVHFFKKR